MTHAIAARLTLLLTLCLISAAAADDGQRRCQQHPVFHSNLKP
jgi:hypothetical protein